MLNHFKQHFFLYIILLLTILATAASYYRFMVTYDYAVYDEIECDPYQSSCFIYCEDDECTEPFYYSLLTRRADVLMYTCGYDYPDCDASLGCMPDEENCENIFCDPEIDNECDTLTEVDYILTEEDLSEMFEAASDVDEPSLTGETQEDTKVAEEALTEEEL